MAGLRMTDDVFFFFALLGAFCLRSAAFTTQLISRNV